MSVLAQSVGKKLQVPGFELKPMDYAFKMMDFVLN